MLLFVNNTATHATSPNLLLALNQHTYVPTYCYHPRLAIAANCRICSVGTTTAPDTVTSCNMPVTPGLDASTGGPLVETTRASTTAFIMLNHPLDCPICDQGGECDLQDISWSQAGPEGFSAQRTDLARGETSLGQAVRTNMTRCITCTKCVRSTDSTQEGGSTLGVPGRGVSANIGHYADDAPGAGTMPVGRSAGVAADLCPVGGISK